MPQYAALIYSADVDWTLPEHAAGHGGVQRVRRGGSRRPPRRRRPLPDQHRHHGAGLGEGRRRVTTDGPYAETKEVLTGFYLLECADLDEAIATAAKIPGGLGRRRRGAPGHRLRWLNQPPTTKRVTP